MNEQYLRLEVFASDREVLGASFHIYNLKSANLVDQPFRVIRAACRKLKNYNTTIGIFENGTHIIATSEINNIPADIDFKLEYTGYRLLPVFENRRVYQEYIVFLIRENIRNILVQGRYRKYSCKADITSSWFRVSDDRYETQKSSDKSIHLERAYKIRVEIRDDGKAYLWLDTKSLFASDQTVMDYINKGQDVCGMEVKNDWSGFRQSGILTEVCEYSVTKELDFGYSLKQYYIDKKKESYRVEGLPDDTPVVKVKLDRGKQELPYYPQALKPIITREFIAKYDPAFSNRIENLVKRNMRMRFITDQEFIADIGILEKIGNLQFENMCCKPTELGYAPASVKLPQLVCGDGRILQCGKEFQVFGHGFYQKPNHKIKVGYLYPRGERELMKQIANDIYLFAARGKYHGKDDRYIQGGLIDIQLEAAIQAEYDIGRITDYKRAALELREIDDLDIVIALIPDNVDEESPYTPFKKIWAEMNIPSQMLTMKTARLFVQDAKMNGNKARYYLHNIVLGILGKTGGIPWVIKDMPGDTDCFVGLDVATVDKGIHYPACSVVFDKYGRMLGFFKPRTAQNGEKISTDILQDIFDQVILSYEEKYGDKPRNIVIHRDGFSNEDAEWYEHYFRAERINYSIIEVRKNVGAKLMYAGSPDLNPPMGYYVFNKKKAYLVTTFMGNKKGSPNPLVIEKNCGDVSIEDAITQVFYLTQLHLGSTQKTRLPITTYYADKICKNLDFVPSGQLENKLFFL